MQLVLFVWDTSKLFFKTSSANFLEYAEVDCGAYLQLVLSGYDIHKGQ